MAPMLTARGYVSTAVLDGKLYAAGGQDDEAETAQLPTFWSGTTWLRKHGSLWRRWQRHASLTPKVAAENGADAGPAAAADAADAVGAVGAVGVVGVVGVARAAGLEADVDSLADGGGHACWVRSGSCKSGSRPAAASGRPAKG